MKFPGIPVRVNFLFKVFCFLIFSRKFGENLVWYSMAWLSVFILLSLLTGTGVCIIVQKKRLSEQERRMKCVLEELNRDAALRNEEIAILRGDNTALQVALNDYRRRFVAQYRMHFSKIENSLDPEKVEGSFITFLQSIVAEIAGKESSQTLFEKRINSDMDGIISKIREDFPSFSDGDIRFVCLLIVGFDNCTISSLMDMNKGQVRTKKSRILSKIRAYKGPNELFYSLFF